MKATNKFPLVLGYLVYNNTDWTETLYAKFEDGRVYSTGRLPLPNSDFDRPGRTWDRVEVLPDNAGFIGNYPVPRALLGK